MTAAATIDLGLVWCQTNFVWLPESNVCLKIFHFNNISKSYFKNCCEILWKRWEKHENYNEAINAMWVVKRRFLA